MQVEQEQFLFPVLNVDWNKLLNLKFFFLTASKVKITLIMSKEGIIGNWSQNPFFDTQYVIRCQISVFFFCWPPVCLNVKPRLAIIEYKSKRMSGRLFHWIPSQIGSVRPGRCVRSSGNEVFSRKFKFWEISKILEFSPTCALSFVTMNQS